jgi:hypothetical protein
MRVSMDRDLTCRRTFRPRCRRCVQAWTGSAGRWKARCSNGNGGNNAEAMEQLAGAVHGLVQQMREEQKVVRQWAQQQSEQNAEIKRMLARVGSGVPPGRG